MINRPTEILKKSEWGKNMRWGGGVGAYGVYNKYSNGGKV